MIPTAPEVALDSAASGGVDRGDRPGEQRAGPDRDEFDIVIIGGGPGGYATALYGAAAGLSVAIVELDKVGGTCLHRGCVPAKEFLETAAVFRTVAGSSQFGVRHRHGPAIAPVVDFSVSQARKQQVVDKLFKGLAGLLKGRGVTVVQRQRHAAARPPGAGLGQRRLDHRDLRADVVLAAGSVPRTIPGFEVDGRW